MIPGIAWMLQKSNGILIRHRGILEGTQVGLHAITIVLQVLAAIKRVRNKLGIVD